MAFLNTSYRHLSVKWSKGELKQDFESLVHGGTCTLGPPKQEHSCFKRRSSAEGSDPHPPLVSRPLVPKETDPLDGARQRQGRQKC